MAKETTPEHSRQESAWAAELMIRNSGYSAEDTKKLPEEALVEFWELCRQIYNFYTLKLLVDILMNGKASEHWFREKWIIYWENRQRPITLATGRRVR